MPNVLVTGGAGFIGSHVVDCLVSHEHRVSIVDNLTRGVLTNLNPGASFFKIDILDPSLRMLFESGKYDYVIHLAGQIDVRQSCTDPIGDAQNNIIGLLNVLNCCREFGVKGVIFASSGGALYAERDGDAVCEGAPKGPLSPYGVSKLSSEYYLSQFSFMTGVPSVVLRLANVYGPRQNSMGEAGVVSIFVERMLGGHPTTIYGDGSQVRDFVYVEDVAQAMLVAVNYMGNNRERTRTSSPRIDDYAFNISTGIGTTISDLRELCASATRYEGITRFEASRPAEIRWSCLAPDKAAAVLGWRAKTSMLVGIDRTVNWAKMKGKETP